MTKLICFFNKRQHYYNRLKKRGGKHWMFLLARKVGNKQAYAQGDCEVWKYKNFLWITQNWKLQTFINKES
jgi:hypothetical protein